MSKSLILYFFIFTIISNAKLEYRQFCQRIFYSDHVQIQRNSKYLAQGSNGKVYEYDCSKYSFIPGYGQHAILKVPKKPNVEYDFEEINFMELLSEYKAFPKYLGCLYTEYPKKVMFMIGKLNYDLKNDVNNFLTISNIERVFLYYKLFDALAKMHEGSDGKKGIVNGDIKPENIMMNSENDNLVFIDFGLANFIGEENYGGTLIYNTYYKEVKKTKIQKGIHDVYALIASIAQIEGQASISRGITKLMIDHKKYSLFQLILENIIENLITMSLSMKNLDLDQSTEDIHGCRSIGCLLMEAIPDPLTENIKSASEVANDLKDFLIKNGYDVKFEDINQDFSDFEKKRKEHIKKQKDNHIRTKPTSFLKTEETINAKQKFNGKKVIPLTNRQPLYVVKPHKNKFQMYQHQQYLKKKPVFNKGDKVKINTYSSNENNENLKIVQIKGDKGKVESVQSDNRNDILKQKRYQKNPLSTVQGLKKQALSNMEDLLKFEQQQKFDKILKEKLGEESYPEKAKLTKTFSQPNFLSENPVNIGMKGENELVEIKEHMEKKKRKNTSETRASSSKQEGSINRPKPTINYIKLNKQRIGNRNVRNNFRKNII